jgi:hypothetical protein
MCSWLDGLDGLTGLDELSGLAGLASLPEMTGVVRLAGLIRSVISLWVLTSDKHIMNCCCVTMETHILLSWEVTQVNFCIDEW